MGEPRLFVSLLKYRAMKSGAQRCGRLKLIANLNSGCTCSYGDNLNYEINVVSRVIFSYQPPYLQALCPSNLFHSLVSYHGNHLHEESKHIRWVQLQRTTEQKNPSDSLA